ncbi:unnamed protein product [Angiostrongylus costaricensis]|uniref:RING-type domain-containing protein n=1 Tax=Angiostrongylus costaricensis TaxID=334426 RepID=A0A158PHV9_ANGCS|nr:unnamed protein product [Angiostrongylus costaricensis]
MNDSVFIFFLPEHKLLYQRVGFFMSEELSSLMIVDEDDFVKEIAESVSIIRDAGKIFERRNDVFTEVMGKRPIENGESSALKATEDAVHEEKPNRVPASIFLFLQEHSDFVKLALEDEINDDIVVVDECGDGDELDTPTSEERELSKKPRNYKRKIVRIPKEVFDYMARIEDDGVVRLNITQLFVFLTNELARKSIHVDANTWDSTDKVPILDVSVPPTAKLNPTLIVDNFDNDPVHREAQETRLKSILEHRQSHIHTILRKPRLHANETAVSKILSVNVQMDKSLAKRQLWREKKGEERKERNEEKSVNLVHEKTEKGNKEKSLSILELRQKRLAVHDALSTAEESNAVGKQSGLYSSNSTYRKPNTRIFPNRRDELTPHSRAGGETRIGNKHFIGHILHHWQLRMQVEMLQKGSLLQFITSMTDEINSKDIVRNREGSVEVSPWSRQPLISRELHKLEEVMRRAAQNNASSIDAARQVEELGLSSVMGTMLNATNHVDLHVPSRGHSFSYSSSLPVRPIASMTNNSLYRNHNDPFGTPQPDRGDFNSRVINDMEGSASRTPRNITTFVEPHGNVNESGSNFSHGGCISYPLMTSAAETRGNPNIPTFSKKNVFSLDSRILHLEIELMDRGPSLEEIVRALQGK